MASNFRAFWLAPVTRNILGYSLFCERREKWRVVSRKFQKKKWRSVFFSIWFGKWRAVDIYLDASPLFTSPSGDSCILFNDDLFLATKVVFFIICLFVPFLTKAQNPLHFYHKVADFDFWGRNLPAAKSCLKSAAENSSGPPKTNPVDDKKNRGSTCILCLPI